MRVELAAYQIVQEALTNVVRHAQVESVDVRVWCEGGRLHIQITDQERGTMGSASLTGAVMAQAEPARASSHSPRTVRIVHQTAHRRVSHPKTDSPRCRGCLL
jgi:anti-sigma regulatory factor (Ser/Thr protein kinase)